MTLDPYSPCPAGTGKKMKFCCPDLLNQWQKIQRMLDGNQQNACLSYIEQLEDEFPERMCLQTTKTVLLARLGRADEAESTVAHMLEAEPKNPVALAEAALMAADSEGGDAAVDLLQKALQASGKDFATPVRKTIGHVGARLLGSGFPYAAAAHFHLHAQMEPEDQAAAARWIEILRAPAFPLIFKNEFHFELAPDDVPWQKEFDRAIAAARRGRWRQAADRIQRIAKKHDAEPIIWQTLGRLYACLADNGAATDAFRRFAALDVPLDEAVEAEAMAQLLDPDTSHDLIDEVLLEYPIGDEDATVEQLIASKRADQLPVERHAASQGDQPPPRAAFALLDRMPLESIDTETPTSSIPQVVGEVYLFGKQTDRDARMELVAESGRELEFAQQALGEILGGELVEPAAQETIGQTSTIESAMNDRWRLPDRSPPDVVEALLASHRQDVVLTRWPNLKMEVLDGKSPTEAAGDDKYRVRLLALVVLLEYSSTQQAQRFDFNTLRDQLSLPRPESVDPWSNDIRQLPVSRWHRIEIEKLEDDDLLEIYVRAAGMRAVEALRLIAEEVIARKTLDGKVDKIDALLVLAEVEPRLEKAIEIAERATAQAEAQNESPARSLLAELSLRMRRGEADHVQRLVDRLGRNHIREPGVREALLQLLAAAGIINPDGTPRQAAAAAPVASAEPAPASEGGIWTPDSDQPAAGKSKLWTPGMD